jgi:lantibiotic biosynthesis protein
VDGIVDPRLLEIWRRRSGAIRAYGELVRRLGTGEPSPLGSLLHMHHNRIAGIAPDVERAVYGIIRGALQAQADRSRAASR